MVVDASVFGAVVFNESRSGEAADLLTPRTLAAPGLVRYEMASAYDAAYICVARDLSAPLLTFDERLAAVWERSGA